MIMHFKKGWQILQDVHDAGEVIGFYKPGFIGQEQPNQVSEWEDLPELKHLQLIYAQQPYFGRELRYFNQAPWWYKQEFDVPFIGVVKPGAKTAAQATRNKKIGVIATEGTIASGL